MMKRYISAVLFIAIGTIFVAILSHSADPAAGVSDKRFAKLAKGGNLPGWLWLGRGPIEGIESRFSDEDIQFMRSLGLTHLRIPIEFNNVYDEKRPDLLKEAHVQLLDQAIEKIIGFGLAVIVDLHSIRLGESGASDYSGPLDKDPAFVETFIRFWSSFAKHLSRHDPEWLFLEPMNEPVFQGHVEQWPPLQERLLKAIRENAPRHTLLATSAHWSNLETFLQLKPLDDPNLVYNFHYYSPFFFTHQGATWSSDNVKSMRDIPYPSTPENVQKALAAMEDETIKKEIQQYGEERWNAERIDADIKKAAEWGERFNVRITCNEFGAYNRRAAEPDRVRWTNDLRIACEKYGIGWTIWDIAGSFGALRREDGRLTISPSMANALGLKSPGGKSILVWLGMEKRKRLFTHECEVLGCLYRKPNKFNVLQSATH